MYPFTKKIYDQINSCSNSQQLNDLLNEIVTGVSQGVRYGQDCLLITLDTRKKVQLIYIPETNYFGIMQMSFGDLWLQYKLTCNITDVISYFYK